MRRDRLAPPRRLLLEPASALECARPGEEPAGRTATPHGLPRGPSPGRIVDHVGDAPERRRVLFDPGHGWFRRLERAASLWLSRRFYPRVPGIHLPYDAQLRRGLTLSEAEVRLAGLAPGFDGFRMLFVSDLHAGPFVSPSALRESLRRLQSCGPDAIVIGGDLLTSQLQEFETHREAFRELSAPCGVFAVLGNHDHYTEDARGLRQRVEALGIRVLHNTSTVLEARGARLSLAGVDDLLRGEVDLAGALAATRPPVVLVSHNPDLLYAAARHGVALMLSGHTHAGQVRIPGLPVLVRQSRYRLDEGRYRFGGTELLVSRGLGAVGLPLRVACPPEGVLIRLRG